MATAFQVTDPTTSRYALSCIQLRGAQGDINASDGHQIYRQAGFTFGCQEDLLVQASKVFAASELHVEQPVLFGKTEDHAAFVIGNWCFWLPIEKEGRFPRLDDALPDPEKAPTTLQLHRGRDVENHGDILLLLQVVMQNSP